MLKSRKRQQQSSRHARPAGFTLIVWSDDAKRSRRLHLSRALIALIALVVVGVAVAIGLLVQRNNELSAALEQASQGSQMSVDREQTLHQVVGSQQQTLNSARDQLTAEREKLVALQSQLSTLEQQLSDLEQFSNQVRSLLGGQVQPAGAAQGGQINAPLPSPTPQGYVIELASVSDDATYHATIASYQDAILRDGQRIFDTRASLEQLQATYLDQTSAQQAQDARAQTTASILADQLAKQAQQQAQKLAAAAASQKAADAIPHGFPYYGDISSSFGWRISPWDATKTGFHPGIDIVADVGTPVMATADGTVITAGWSDSFGRVIRIQHAGGLVTLYGHNSRLLVYVGEQIQRGQIIAYSGNTGMSTGPHIHYGIYRNGVAVNPILYR